MGFWSWLMGTPGDSRTPAPARTAKRRDAGPPPTQRGTVQDLRIGDVVSYEGVDYLVKNAITYDDDDFVWNDYLLYDAATESEHWLSVEDDDGLEVGLYHDVEIDEAIPPVPHLLTIEGLRYKLTEHSNAAVTVEREEASRWTHSTVEYWDFKGPNDRYVSVTRWGGQFEVSVGFTIKPYELTIFPADVSR